MEKYYKIIISVTLGLVFSTFVTTCSTKSAINSNSEMVENQNKRIDSLIGVVSILKNDMKEVKETTSDINNTTNSMAGAIGKINPSVNIRIKQDDNK